MKVYFNNSCKICRSEINLYKKENIEEIDWIDITNNSDAEKDTSKKDKDLLRRLHDYNCPSGNYFEYQAFAIGSRSQAAKTYLERRFESFRDTTRDNLVKDALMAIRETLQGETLKSSICTIAVVGAGGSG